MNKSKLHQVDIDILMKINNPLKCELDSDSIWGCRITSSMIHECVRTDDTLSRSDFLNDKYSDGMNHARRIAYLVKNGWKGSLTLNIPNITFKKYSEDPFLINTSDWIIEDGNHRLIAAWFMCQTLIGARFISRGSTKNARLMNILVS